MRLRSLRSRTVAAGVIVVAVVLGGLDAFVYLSLRQQLDANAEALLHERAELARSLGEDHEPEALARRLQMSGIRAVITLPDGTEVWGRPASGALGAGLAPPGGGGDGPTRTLSRAVALPDGSTATVYVSIDGAQATLEHMRFLLLSGTVLGVGLAALMLRRWFSGEMRPLEELIGAARRVAAGERGVRLRPRRAATEIGQLSLAFDEATASLEAALDEARQVTEASQTFLADAAHQLRTPITGIRAAAEVLVMDLHPDDHRRAVELLVGQSARVGVLLSGLLRLAKLDLGEEPRQEMVDLDTVCRTEVERARPLCPGIVIGFRSELGSSAPIELDPLAIAEVLSNLLDNACRHAARRIDVAVAVVGANIEISVADDGRGVEPDDVDRIFNRFVSLDSDGGSGLGLPIARALVEAHGGTLVYRDRRFVIQLARERRHRSIPRRKLERSTGRGDRRRSTPAGRSGHDLVSPVLTGVRTGSGRRHDRTAGDARSDR